MDNNQKVLAVYRYIKELCSLKYKTVTDISNQPYSFALKDIPDNNDNITIAYRDRIDEEVSMDDVIIQVKKPEFQLCPIPPNEIKQWLHNGWDDFINDVSRKEKLEEQDPEHFGDSIERADKYNAWVILRENWVANQIIINRIRKLFLSLYQLHTTLERESETLELMVGNGTITDKSKSIINHPIMLKRVKLEFDAKANIIKIVDTDAEPELYTMLLQDMADINHGAIKALNEELQDNFYHPLDRNDTPEYLKKLIHTLCGQSKFIDESTETEITDDDRLIMYFEPVFFVRKRIDGSLRTIEEIIKVIEETGEVPKHLIELVGAGESETSQENYHPTIDELLATASGESANILLSKEANREQLEIAQRIEKYSAVLVQGPPGTGKTHTIANLLGHFLAQGKSVLVTSHTKKALTVLKDKVPKGIQNLCVSVLDDTSKDMERSVDGISEYLSQYTSNELKEKMDIAQKQRLDIIENLALARRKVHSVKYREYEPIIFDGVSYSPASAADFVNKNAEELSYIPGKVKLYQCAPLTMDELITLYRSNDKISDNDEIELKMDIPNPLDLISPAQFETNIIKCRELDNDILQMSNELNKKISFNYNTAEIIVEDENSARTIANNLNSLALQELLNYVKTFNGFEEWMIYAVVDGKKGNGYRQRWDAMIELIDQTVDFAQSFIAEKTGKQIAFPEVIDFNSFEITLKKMEELFSKKGKISKADLFFNKQIEGVLSAISINNLKISSLEECVLVEKQLLLLKRRRELSLYWDELLSTHGVPKFDQLDTFEPERICKNMIPQIKRYLDWYAQEFDSLIKLTNYAGFDSNKVFVFTDFDAEIVTVKKLLETIDKVLTKYIFIAQKYLSIAEWNKTVSECLAKLQQNQLKSSRVCNRVYSAISSQDTSEYQSAYNELTTIYNKRADIETREVLLSKLEKIAPEWANAIKDRKGKFGEVSVPENIDQAWKWKQFSGIIEEITSEPFEEMQQKCVEYSKELRKKTTELAEYSAWYNLLLRTEKNLDMRQALQGWKKTVKKIGKGTGKNAPMLKKEARELMAKCQTAVPAWIMPVNKALESLKPSENSFDIIIVDEASQSDISALAIVYMGKKIIIVGDDKQVSPMAVGVDIDRMNALIEMYIKDIIPNWHLYDAKSSLYDIAGTTFQPLMLREHFRCAPEIIGYSNKVSYDFKIKPLRDMSTCKITPSVVNYRVLDGEREGARKTNTKEAQAVVALISSCLEQKEYDGMTFGVISLLGDEQAQTIQQFIFDKFEPSVIEERKIMCGNASHFQGDERDVMFLSMVDSNQGADSQLTLSGDGADQSRKQRYNVAASRAKDQMWVVHSIDSARDLKVGDMRKELLEYAENPQAICNLPAKTMKKSDAPFEEMVATALIANGYNITEQWEVGAYRIDMVAMYENIKIAIECDGELYHSGEEKVKEEMERQNILERLGWRFIRIRGSEYFRNPEETVKRVLNGLNSFGVFPESKESKACDSNPTNTSQLLDKVKLRATEIIDEWNSSTEIKS